MEVLLWCYRKLFYCRRNVLNFFFKEEEYDNQDRVSVTDIPWLWVGYRKSGSEAIAVTDLINESLYYGSCVDIEYLKDVTGIMDDVHWEYLDPVELVEKDFPSTGFLIDNASVTTNEIPDSGHIEKSD